MLRPHISESSLRSGHGWRALPDGRDAGLQVLPTTFNWLLFWVAWLLMASPALHQVASLPTKKSVR